LPREVMSTSLRRVWRPIALSVALGNAGARGAMMPMDSDALQGGELR
jgi:hypothetical protein